MKNASPINLFHTLVQCRLKHKAHAGAWENLVAIAILKNLELNSKKLLFNTKCTIFTISFVGTFLYRNFLYCSQRTSRPSVQDILGYSLTASAELELELRMVSHVV